MKRGSFHRDQSVVVLYQMCYANALLLAHHAPSVYLLLVILHSVDVSKMRGSLFVDMFRVALDPPDWRLDKGFRIPLC